MKKLFLILLIFVCIFSFASCKQDPADQGVNGGSGNSGKSYFTLLLNSKTGTYYVKANGEATLPTTLEIPSTIGDYTIAGIAKEGFYGKTGVQTVSIPDTVTAIEDYAFAYCQDLKSITLGSSVSSLGANAFQSCLDLASINFPAGLSQIPSDAFIGCSSLATVDLTNVSAIGDHAFESCSALATITLGSGLTTIEGYAFAGCTSLTAITYLGTKAQWEAIDKSSTMASGALVIHCSDGDVSVTD